MKDENKPKKQLIEELVPLRQQVAELKTLEAERKQAEETLREREEMIRALVETSQDWIWSIDGQGIHTYCNPAVEAILGYRPEELAGKPGLDFIHPFSPTVLARKVREVLDAP